MNIERPETWQAQTTLLLTQPGFPEGRALFPNPETQGERSKYSYSDPSRFASLTGALLAVRTERRGQGARPTRGRAPRIVGVGSPGDPEGSSAYTLLPVIALFGKAQSRSDAVETTRLGTQAFMAFLDRKAREAEIPESQRVQVDVLAQPREAVVIEPRKKTLPIVVFLTVITGTVGLVFVLENLRSRVRPVPDAAPGDSAAVTDARRTA